MLKHLRKDKFRYLLAGILILIFLLAIFRVDLYLQFNPNGAVISSKLNDLLTTFRSIFVQAIPFVLLGALVSAIVNVYVKQEWLLRLIPKNKYLGHITISLFGVLMPVCECGNVPIGRSLVMKGVRVSQVITFLLAAPIINPVTILATWEAFQDPVILITRVVGAFFIANFIGILFSFKKDQNELLAKEFYAEVCETDHHHDHGPKLKQFVTIFTKEFVLIMEMLVIGAGIAALFQTFIPRELLLSIGSSPLLSILAMILFSFVISVCSSVDAFIVLPYVSTFTTGSIVSYLIFGPMIDIKILTLMRSTFTARTLVILTTLVTLFSILIGLMVNFFL